jgi:hypothetical protein
MILSAKYEQLFIDMQKIFDESYVLQSSFDRYTGKFVEDPTELYTIGNDLLIALGIDILSKIKRFIDICSAPGIYSSLLLKMTPNLVCGTGITLDISKGGEECVVNHPKYTILYKDILHDNISLYKTDLVIASCVCYEYNKKKAYELNWKLIIKSIIIGLTHLKENGYLIVNLTLKNIDLSMTIINILSSVFNKYKLWKSKIIWANKQTFYFIGYEYSGDNIIKNLEELDIMSNRFHGSKEEYTKIWIKIIPIIKIRISALRKNISQINDTL